MVVLDSVEAGELQSFIEQIERMEEERAALGNDIRELFAAAKSAGFDIRTMRQVLKLRKIDPIEQREQENLLELYRQAVGIGVHECWF